MKVINKIIDKIVEMKDVLLKIALYIGSVFAAVILGLNIVWSSIIAAAPTFLGVSVLTLKLANNAFIALIVAGVTAVFVSVFITKKVVLRHKELNKPESDEPGFEAAS